jgi:hypothetical protein
MGRSAKPRKAYRPRTPNSATLVRTQPWILDTTFGPLQEMLEHVARGGELHETDKGALIYISPSTRKPYEVPAAIKAYAEIFAIVRARDPVCPDVEPLRRVSADIKTGEVDEGVVKAALACLHALRSYTAGKPADFIADAAQSVALRAHMDAAEKLARLSNDQGEQQR